MARPLVFMHAAGLVVATMLVASAALAQGASQETPRKRVRARYDTLLRWAPRYQLSTTEGPLGLQQQYWRRADALPLYHRITVDASNLIDGTTSVHFSGWGALNLLADSTGAFAVGDIAIGYAEFSLSPLRSWAGRRFVTYGPPGGLHVDGIGMSLRAQGGFTAEIFLGRPVTPNRNNVVGGQASFEGPAFAYGARLAYAYANRLRTSLAYAESIREGMTGSRTIDAAGSWYQGAFRFESAAKIDVLNLGLAQAQVVGSWRASALVECGLAFLHVEPGRWIPAWSILSVFETSTFDELSLATTLRVARPISVRAEIAGRKYSAQDEQEARFGYRGDLTARGMPTPRSSLRWRINVSRRDDGVVGYTLLNGGIGIRPWTAVVTSIDGSFAIDDEGGRDSALLRLSADYEPSAAWILGATVSLARTPLAEAEMRGLLRASWRIAQP